MERRIDLDFIKGISIIAVILYHVGILPYGYLGVDVFLVISGFLIIPPVLEKIVTCDFQYSTWIWRRVVRFIPIVVTVCAASLIIGYFIMVPDDYDSLAQSTIASELFANNILLSITTRNYWALENEYKPLLALWYLGVVVQFFIIFPFIFLFVAKLVKRQAIKKAFLISLFLLTLFSFTLYNLPIFDSFLKHYGLPFRIWEFCIGAFAFYSADHIKTNYNKIIYVLLLAFLLIILCIGLTPLQEVNHVRVVGSIPKSIAIPPPVLLITTVIISAILVMRKTKINWWFNGIAYLGKISLSLFIWHQAILAYMRYIIADNLSTFMFLVFLVCVIIISIISYNWIEKIKIRNRVSKLTLFICWSIVLCCSFYIYYRDGDMVDVTTESKQVFTRRVDGAAYVDHIFSYERPFSTNKTKVLVIGNSFARDFINCLDEWDNDGMLEISYNYIPVKDDTRYKQADYLFIFLDKRDVPQFIWDSISPDCKVYGIGTKNFGKIIGSLYFKNRNADYNFSLHMPKLLRETNDILKESWGEDHYIDFVKASLNDKGEIKVYTPDSLFISFDCLHLAPAGAKYFSTRLGFDSIFWKNE